MALLVPTPPINEVDAEGKYLLLLLLLLSLLLLFDVFTSVGEGGSCVAEVGDGS